MVMHLLTAVPALASGSKARHTLQLSPIPAVCSWYHLGCAGCCPCFSSFTSFSRRSDVGHVVFLGALDGATMEGVSQQPVLPVVQVVDADPASSLRGGRSTLSPRELHSLQVSTVAAVGSCTCSVGDDLIATQNQSSAQQLVQHFNTCM